MLPKLPARTTFDQFAAVSQRYAIRAVGATYLPAILDEDGSEVMPAQLTVQVERIPGQQPEVEWSGIAPEAAMPNNAQPKQKAGLKNILAGLLERAGAEPGKAQSANLEHGLRVQVLVSADRQTHSLMIARHEKEPGPNEWSIVLAHWPYDPPLDIAQISFQHNGWHGIKASWPAPADSPNMVQAPLGMDQSSRLADQPPAQHP